jgi:hypothetical protein
MLVPRFSLRGHSFVAGLFTKRWEQWACQELSSAAYQCETATKEKHFGRKEPRAAEPQRSADFHRKGRGHGGHEGRAGVQDDDSLTREFAQAAKTFSIASLCFSLIVVGFDGLPFALP